MSGASAALAKLPPPRPADGFVLAVQRVAALWGGKPDAESIQLAAAVLFVLLLELGSALGFVVADALASQGRPSAAVADQVAPRAQTAAGEALACASKAMEPSAGQTGLYGAGNGPGARLDQPAAQPVALVAQLSQSSRPAVPAAQLDARLREVLETGPFDGRLVDLAKATGCSKTTLGRRLEALAAGGVVRVSAQAGRGTRVELVRGLRICRSCNMNLPGIWSDPSAIIGLALVILATLGLSACS